MGYFSNLAIDYLPYIHDHSFFPPEKQLLWRLEELEGRYHELVTQKTGKRDEGVGFSEDDLRYVLPEYFASVSDVRKAINLAIRDLRERYGIYVDDEPTQEETAIDEITGMQISFMDVLALQTPCVPQSAA